MTLKPAIHTNPNLTRGELVVARQQLQIAVRRLKAIEEHPDEQIKNKTRLAEALANIHAAEARLASDIKERK